MFQIERISRSKLRQMSNGSRPIADRITPTRIDSRMSRTRTDSGDPPKNRCTAPLVIDPPSAHPRFDTSTTCAELSPVTRRVGTQQPLQGLDPVRIRGALVPAQAADARKSHRKARFVASG